jgi:hypothetical protein
MSDEDFLRWLADSGYRHPMPLPGGRYACINVRYYNTQIITGRWGNRIGWDNAW